ncbi:hypothetical protein GCM10028857_27170 [Salinarchaeum chitinilyticum]
MTDDVDSVDSAGDDAPSGESAGLPARIWQRLVAAAGWFADTFRGHSGANQFEKREK